MLSKNICFIKTLKIEVPSLSLSLDYFWELVVKDINLSANVLFLNLENTQTKGNPIRMFTIVMRQSSSFGVCLRNIATLRASNLYSGRFACIFYV